MFWQFAFFALRMRSSIACGPRTLRPPCQCVIPLRPLHPSSKSCIHRAGKSSARYKIFDLPPIASTPIRIPHPLMDFLPLSLPPRKWTVSKKLPPFRKTRCASPASASTDFDTVSCLQSRCAQASKFQATDKKIGSSRVKVPFGHGLVFTYPA